MTKRKIIQIVVHRDPDDGSGRLPSQTIYGLANDGSLWRVAKRRETPGRYWLRLLADDDLPQPEDDE